MPTNADFELAHNICAYLGASPTDEEMDHVIEAIVLFRENALKRVKPKPREPAADLLRESDERDAFNERLDIIRNEK